MGVNYLRLGLAIALAVLTAACAFLFHAWRAEAEEFAEFRGRVDALGQAAEARAKDRIALDRARKEASDASYQVALGVLGGDVGRLREQANGGGVRLSPAPANSACPAGWRCFDREQFDTALRVYFEREAAGAERTVGLIVEGAKVKLRLDTAIRWANPDPH